MGLRHLAREAALQAMYACDFSNNWEIEKCVFCFEHFSMTKAAREYALEICAEIIKNLKEIDQAIETTSKNWSLSRMSRVDRNILRLSTYELLYTETPINIIINEAIEIAKDFSANDSPKFVNGLLDKIAEKRKGVISVEIIKEEVEKVKNFPVGKMIPRTHLLKKKSS